jgi:signal transduction histidine kinase
MRRAYPQLPLSIDWEPGAKVPGSMEPLVQSVLAEALLNCEKHARASTVNVRVGSERDAFCLEVRNDGVLNADAAKGSRMGLRLAALEAIQKGGMVEFGPLGADEWRVRLVLPPER